MYEQASLQKNETIRLAYWECDWVSLKDSLYSLEAANQAMIPRSYIQ